MRLGTAIPASRNAARASSSHATTMLAVTPHVVIIPRSRNTVRIVKNPSCVFRVMRLRRNGELFMSSMFTSASGVGLVSKYA